MSSSLWVLILSFILPWVQGWWFRFSVLSKPAQEICSQQEIVHESFPPSGLAAPSGRMVLVVDINGDCWRSATWG